MLNEYHHLCSPVWTCLLQNQSRPNQVPSPHCASLSPSRPSCLFPATWSGLGPSRLAADDRDGDPAFEKRTETRIKSWLVRKRRRFIVRSESRFAVFDSNIKKIFFLESRERLFYFSLYYRWVVAAKIVARKTAVLSNVAWSIRRRCSV